MKYPLMRNNILREDLDAVIEHLKQDDPILTHGANVRAFEAEWSQWLGVKYSVFVNSGASANLLSMAILKIRHPDGGEIITPPLTWVSDVASVLQNGFTPVFADIDPFSLAMDSGMASVIKTPISELSSSTSPIAQMRKWSFSTRLPSPKPVMPASPVRVVIFESRFPIN
jgi:dTDP-4-amino-4,6-dideoxygalactose transaminase